MGDRIKLRTKIAAPFIRSTLFRGTIIASVGFAALLYVGVASTAESLSSYGFVLILASLGVISAGMIPYRQLVRLQEQPNELLLTESSLQFISRSSLLFTLPLISIEQVLFCDNSLGRGIGIKLKHPLPEKICVHDKKFKMEREQKKALSKHGCDLFLDYFTSHAAEEIREVLKSR